MHVPVALLPEKETPGTHWKGGRGRGHRADMSAVAKKQNPFSALPEIEPRSPSLYAGLYTD